MIGNAPGVDPQAPPAAFVRTLPDGSAESPSSVLASQGPGIYALRGVYFKREWFESPAACLTAAYARGLPLSLCR